MWLYYLAKAVCMFAFRIWYKLDYQGTENIPAGGGYILMANHRSMIDPIILAEKAHGQVRYMGKMELFRNPILGWALRTIGTFPVDRGAGDTSAIDNSRKVIEEGDILGIFPEGHRSKDGEPLRPKSGVAGGPADRGPGAALFGILGGQAGLPQEDRGALRRGDPLRGHGAHRVLYGPGSAQRHTAFVW